MELSELQAAFFEMTEALGLYVDGWIITVFPDFDPRVHGAVWLIDMSNPPPTMYMSDSLYAMYCASIGMKNENMKR